jgi:hypothetical protein
VIDLDALKSELEAAGLDPSGSWREWLVVGNITAYRRGAVYMSPGVEIDQQDFKALAIIARHVAPVVTPEPDVLPPEVEAALNASLREHRAIYQQLADTPEPDAEVRDVLAEAIRITPHGALGDGPNAYDRTADAGLAALRDKGFAVVRTADVGGLCPPSVIAWFVKHGYDFESMRESLRAFPDDSEYMDELSDALVAAEHWVADDEVYARVKEAIR